MSTAATTGPAGRPTWAQVVLPTEHGGWGLTAEPALMGLLVAPSVAGLCLSLAAVVAFMARTPLKVVLVDRRRGRHLPRTQAAARVLAGELAAVGTLGVATAATTGSQGWWWPLVAAAPLVLTELWFDVRSRGRRLVPEVAGAGGVATVAATVALLGGTGARLAVALWAVQTARVATSVPFVRDQVARIHHRPPAPETVRAGNLTALALTCAAVALALPVLAGAVAVVAVVGVQMITGGGDPPTAKVLGVRQTLLGLAVVAGTAAGVHLW